MSDGIVVSHPSGRLNVMDQEARSVRMASCALAPQRAWWGRGPVVASGAPGYLELADGVLNVAP